MTDNEIIRHLAKTVMGWHSDYRNGAGAPWNPLTSRSDCAEVEAKVLAGPKGNEYVFRLHDKALNGNAVIGSQKLYRYLITAPLRDRCESMVAVTQCATSQALRGQK